MLTNEQQSGAVAGHDAQAGGELLVGAGQLLEKALHLQLEGVHILHT